MVRECLPHHRRIPETGPTGSGHEPAKDNAGLFFAARRALFRSSQEYRDYEAVSRAINTARTWRDGASVLAVVSAHTWGKRLRFDEIGRAMYMSTASAKRLHQRFVYEVARELGYKS